MTDTIGDRIEDQKEILEQLSADGLVKALLGYELSREGGDEYIVDSLIPFFSRSIASMNSDDSDYASFVSILRTYLNDQNYLVRTYGARLTNILLAVSSVPEVGHLWNPEVHESLVASCQQWAYMPLPDTQAVELRFWASRALVEAERLFWRSMVELAQDGEEISGYTRSDFREETLLENLKLAQKKVLVQGDVVYLAYFDLAMTEINKNRAIVEQCIKNDASYDYECDVYAQECAALPET